MIEICAEGKANQAAAWLTRYRGKTPSFACVLSFTETGLLPGISAAGQTRQDRCRTATADGAFLTNRSSVTLPRLAAGISPAVITRAVLHSLDISCQLLSTGLPTEISAPHIALSQVQAQGVHTGRAMSLSAAHTLFEAGKYWGHQLARNGHYLIIGESVVGGTTTAQAVLTALGYDVANRMSSSLLVGNHAQKQQLVQAGIAAGHRSGLLATASPINIVAAVGDPMQLVVAGMAITASQLGGVLLAGGSQMLAVYALIKRLIETHAAIDQATIGQIVVGTTRWVIEDRSADTVAIATQLNAPYLASQLNFHQSRYVQLQAYERGFVKEGVGAGGCAIAAHLYARWNNAQLNHAIEREVQSAY